MTYVVVLQSAVRQIPNLESQQEWKRSRRGEENQKRRGREAKEKWLEEVEKVPKTLLSKRIIIAEHVSVQAQEIADRLLESGWKVASDSVAQNSVASD